MQLFLIYGCCCCRSKCLWKASLHVPELATLVAPSASQKLFRGDSVIFATDVVLEGSADCQRVFSSPRPTYLSRAMRRSCNCGEENRFFLVVFKLIIEGYQQCRRHRKSTIIHVRTFIRCKLFKVFSKCQSLIRIMPLGKMTYRVTSHHRIRFQ